MAQTSDEIESQIRNTREDLRSNLEELEGRVKSAVDWRERFRRNPGLGVGLAVGGGFLLASLTTRPRRTAWRGSAPAPYPRRSHFQLLLDNVQSTLIGIAAARAADLVANLLIGRTGPGPIPTAAPADGDAVQGEGDYRAARSYRRSAESFAHTADVERAARQAAPGDANEAAAMARAEAAGRARGRD
jgi:hypothetical protein